jgi:hypothetical protein
VKDFKGDFDNNGVFLSANLGKFFSFRRGREETCEHPSSPGPDIPEEAGGA